MATGISARLSPKKLRQFGITVAIPLALLAGIGVWRGHTVLPAVLGGLALSLGGLALLAPHWLGPVHTLWMKMANGLAWFNTRILLGIVYFMVMTPTGIVMRLLGRDPLDRRIGDRPSYWVARKPNAESRGAMDRRF